MYDTIDSNTPRILAYGAFEYKVSSLESSAFQVAPLWGYTPTKGVPLIYNTMLSAHHLNPRGMGFDFSDIWGGTTDFLSNVASGTLENLEAAVPQVAAQQIIAANVPGYKQAVPVAVRPPVPSMPTLPALTPTGAATVAVPVGAATPAGYTKLPGTQTAVSSTVLYVGIGVVSLVAVLLIMNMMKKKA